LKIFADLKFIPIDLF